MRAVVQRVEQASVEVAGETIAAMGHGLLALVGVAQDDAMGDADELARKIVHLRIFDDDDGRMNRSLVDVHGTLGVVSQFTLLADCRKGRRPSLGEAAAPEAAEPLVAAVALAAEALGVSVITGRFQTTMRISLVNHGPVTILLDTQKQF